MRALSCTAALLAALLVARTSLASDHTNLEDGLPVEVTDAYPLKAMTREVQARLQYRYTPEGEHAALLEPRLDFGVPYNGQIALRVPMFARYGNGEGRFDLGRIGLEYLYNVNQETTWLPAFSFVAGLEAPDTRDGGSFDPYAALRLSKQIPGSSQWHRVHLNGTLQANVARTDEERSYRYFAAVGYDVRLRPTVVGVVDAVRDQPMRNRAASNFGEVGLRIQVTPLLSVALGAGAGATDEGRFITRATTAFQMFAF